MTTQAGCWHEDCRRSTGWPSVCLHPNAVSPGVNLYITSPWSRSHELHRPRRGGVPSTGPVENRRDRRGGDVVKDIPCPECGHTDRMHIRGAAPKYRGCMVKVVDGVRVNCRCRLGPEEIRVSSPEPKP